MKVVRPYIPLLVVVLLVGMLASPGAPQAAAQEGSGSDGSESVTTEPPEEFLTEDEAAESEQRQDRREELDGEIDLLRQSDVELQAEVDRLEDEIAGMEARTAELTAELDATRDRLAELEGQVDDARAELDHHHARAVERIVQAYMHPPMDNLAIVISGEDVSDVSRRLGMMNEIAAHDREILEARQAAADALDDLEEETARTATELEASTLEHEADLAELRDARARHDEVSAALQERIADFQSEADALAASEDELASLIADRAAEAATTTTTAPPETTTTTTTTAPPETTSGDGNGNASTSATTSAPSSPPASSGELQWPAEGPMTSPYGMRWGRMHQGIDIGAPMGAPIYAAAAGTVFHAASMGGYGNLTLIDHGNGMVTAYAHQSSFDVMSGSVSRGQVIGRIGSTGNSTGPHLHFEVRMNGSAVDPMPYLS